MPVVGFSVPTFFLIGLHILHYAFQRQPEGKCSTCPHFRRNGYFSSQTFDDSLAYRQSQPRALSEVIELGKALKHPSQLLRFDAQSGVFYVKYHFFGFLPVAVAHAALCRELKCISYQVREYLENPVLVRVNAQSFVRRVEFQFHSLRAAEHMCIMNLFAKRVQLYRSVSELHDARFYFRQIQYFIDQLQQPFVVGIHYFIIFFSLFRVFALRDDA